MVSQEQLHHREIAEVLGQLPRRQTQDLNGPSGTWAEHYKPYEVLTQGSFRGHFGSYMSVCGTHQHSDSEIYSQQQACLTVLSMQHRML